VSDPRVDAILTSIFQVIVPEAALIGVACVLFILSTLRAGRNTAAVIALGGLALAAVLHFIVPAPGDLVEHPVGAKVPDAYTVSRVLAGPFTGFIRVAALITGAILVFVGWYEPDDRRAADYFACLLVITAGLALVGMANDLIFLFLALELVSIPTYVMLYLPKRGQQSGLEATIKYFLLSVMSSALLLFGFSYLYGITGTTNIKAVLHILERSVAGDTGNMAVIAAVMVLAGLGFRITAFPFHFYAPDVFQGGPTGVVALLSFVPKVAGFAALLRLFGAIGLDAETAPQFARSVMLVLWVLAAVTMTAGNVLALLQNNVRRILAYSSVAHAGYLLMGLAILPAQVYQTSEPVVRGAEAILFYLVAYGAMTVGTFAVLAYLDTPDHTVESVDDLAGLHETHPRMALFMALFLFSLIGLPLTAGFAGKLLLFLGALAAPTQGPMQHLYQVLALVAALNAAVGAYYYLRIAGVMYLRSSFRPRVMVRAYPAVVAAVICAIVTIWFGVYPWPMLNIARDAVAPLAIGLP